MKVLVTKDGAAVTAVYSDRLLTLMERLGGNKQITRASEVEWCNVDGVWVATGLKHKDTLAREPTRQQALRKEAAELESRLHEYV